MYLNITGTFVQRFLYHDTIGALTYMNRYTIGALTYMYSFTIDQGLSKHQEVSSTPMTKARKKIIVVFLDLLGARKR